MTFLTFSTVGCLRMPELAGQPPTPETPLADILSGAAAAGFRHVGIDNYTVGAFSGDVAGLLEEHALRCSDVGVLRIGDPQETLRSADMLAELGEHVGARLCVTAFDVDPWNAYALVVRCVERLARAGIRLAVEFLPYTPLSTLAQARDLCAAIGWERCGLLVDSWMFFRGSNSWAELRALTAGQIAYVQLDDAPELLGTDLAFESRHRRVLPGRGVFDLTAFTGVLDQIGFAGPVAVEVLNPRFRTMRPVDQGLAAIAAAQAVWPALGQGALT